jgi:hypothetical protein
MIRTLEGGSEEGHMCSLIVRNLLQRFVEGCVMTGLRKIFLGVIGQTFTVKLALYVLSALVELNA